MRWTTADSERLRLDDECDWEFAPHPGRRSAEDNPTDASGENNGSAVNYRYKGAAVVSDWTATEQRFGSGNTFGAANNKNKNVSWVVGDAGA